MIRKGRRKRCLEVVFSFYLCSAFALDPLSRKKKLSSLFSCCNYFFAFSSLCFCFQLFCFSIIYEFFFYKSTLPFSLPERPLRMTFWTDDRLLPPMGPWVKL